MTANRALVGEWRRETGFDDGAGGTICELETLVLDAPGSATFVYSGEENCSGDHDYAGATWSPSTTMLSLKGQAECSGTMTCTVTGLPVSASCDGTALDLTGTMTYALSDADATLTITYSDGSSETFMRR